MGAAFEVYNRLGYGMAEEIYQQSLEIELSLRGIPFQSKCEINVFYKNQCLDTHYIPDLIAYGAVVVELKAVASLSTDHEAQLFNYLRIARQQVGYLLNFGKKCDLEWRRFILTDLHSPAGEALIEANPHSVVPVSTDDFFMKEVKGTLISTNTR
jgi:GxxExxY protein